MELDDIYFELKDFYRYGIKRESCEKCRNWSFAGFREKGKIKSGYCTLYDCYLAGHGWCNIFGMEINTSKYEMIEDGWIRVHTTPTGKKIVQESRSGIWMYKKDAKNDTMQQLYIK